MGIGRAAPPTASLTNPRKPLTKPSSPAHNAASSPKQDVRASPGPLQIRFRRHIMRRISLLFLAAPAILWAAQNPTPAAAPSSNEDKPRIFITDSQSWEISGSGGGANGAYGSHMSGGARPQTA